MLKHKKVALAPRKEPKTEPKKTVLVGTYAGSQLEDWPGYYPYPILKDDKIDVEACKKVNEIWLFKGTKDAQYFAAEFIGIKTREELKALGYPAKGKGHGDGTYLLFKITKAYAPANTSAALAASVEQVIIRTKDFAHRSPKVARQLKAYLESPDRNDPELAAQLPSILTTLPPTVLRVCEAAVQMDFFDIMGMSWKPPVVDLPSGVKPYNFISLFTGAGGLDIGFREAGFNCLFASDIMKEAAETYRENNHGTPFFCGDVRQLQSSDIRRAIGSAKVDVIVGGPPCQGFSNMGNKNSGDPRNLLFESYVRIVNDLQPSCFLFENVKGLYTMFEGRYFKKVVAAFTQIGYNLYFSILNTANYGVPQKRERIIIVGTRNEAGFKFPYHSDTPVGSLQAFKNVGEAIGDLVDKGEEVPNHIALKHGEIVTARYKLIPEGGKLPPPDQLPLEIRRGNFGNTYQRLARNAVASTMVPGNNAFPIHPTLDRSLTPREAARIQTFPDKYIFCGDRRSQCIEVGNAVPPLFASKLAIAIRDYLLNGKSEGLDADRYFEHGAIVKEDKSADKRATLKFADLFCGAGGFTQGMKDAGLQCVLGVDYEKYCTEAYRINQPDHECLRLDLSDENNQIIVGEKLKKIGVDLIVGGPPCQGFSIFGKRRFVYTKNHDVQNDARNNLVFAYANIVRIASPRWFIMENVPGILSARDGEYIKEIKAYFTNLGYRLDSRVINAADYGAPQVRRRFLLVGTKTDLMFPWPKPKYYENPESWQQPYRTVGEAIMDLAEVTGDARYKNHDAPHHNAIVAARMSYIPEGGRMDVEKLPPELSLGVKTKSKVANYSKVFYRLSRSQPAPTVVPGHNAFPVHPTLNRTLTVREAARLQTFPDRYEFVGPIINKALQVGNAFPCIVAQLFGERLRTVENKGWTENSATTLAMKSMFGGQDAA